MRNDTRFSVYWGTWKCGFQTVWDNFFGVRLSCNGSAQILWCKFILPYYWENMPARNPLHIRPDKRDPTYPIKKSIQFYQECLASKNGVLFNSIGNFFIETFSHTVGSRFFVQRIVCFLLSSRCVNIRFSSLMRIRIFKRDSFPPDAFAIVKNLWFYILLSKTLLYQNEVGWFSFMQNVYPSKSKQHA